MKPIRFGNIALRLAILALLLPAGLLMAQNRDSEAISKLLDQVKNHAAMASDDAAELESYTRSRLSWETHALQLTQMKEHVNNLLQDASKMIELRDEGSPWQQEAIDRIDPLLPEMAAHLTAMINHYNDNKNRLNMKPYRDFVLANQELIDHAHDLISNFAAYSEAKSRADELERRLELTPPSEPGS